MISGEAHVVHELAAAWNQAIVANDAEAISGFVTPDWVLVGQDGPGQGTDFLTLVSTGELTHSAMETVEDTERLRIYGDTAVRTARVTNTAHYRGRTFVADEWTTDVYIRTDQGWRCVLSHVTPAQQ